jgi:hypothetical protein
MASVVDVDDLDFGSITDVDPDALLRVYAEVCRSYQAVDDFRVKLLGLLPVISLAAIFGLGRESLFTQTPMPDAFRHLVAFIGIFAATFTLSLFIYEIRGILRCHDLISRGYDIERRLSIRGQFCVCRDGHLRSKSPGWRERVGGFLDAKLAACVVYSTVAAAWLFTALRFGFAIQIEYCIAWALGTGLVFAVTTLLFVNELIAP